MDSTRCLRYGDRIIFKNKAHRLFLASKGTDSMAGVFLKLPDDGFLENPYLYPNLLELVFEIHPQLNYDAAKEFNDLMDDDKHKGTAEKRRNLEEKLNYTKLNENCNKPIYLGSIVQLWHVATRTYLQINPQKITGTEMGVLGASKDTNENVQFMITLPISVYKKETPLNYDNSFVLQDLSKKSIAFPLENSGWQGLELKLKEPPKSESFFGVNKVDVIVYNIPYIVENQNTIKGYHAGYISETDIGSTYGRDFQAYNVSQYFASMEGIVLWGNAINIKNVNVSPGKVSMMICEVNKSSVKKSVVYRNFNNIEIKKVVSAEANFQIIPMTANLVGSPINYDRFKTVTCLLKCCLSGKFLKEDPINHQLVVAEEFDKERANILNRKSKIESEYRERYNKYKEGNYLAGEFSQYDVDLFESKSKEKEPLKNDKDIFAEYIRQLSFRLQKMSSDDDAYINNSNFFKIISPSGRTVSIADSKINSEIIRDPQEKQFFGGFDKEMQSAYVTEHKMEMVPMDSSQYSLFNFQDVTHNLELKVSRITPMITALCQAPTPQQISRLYLMEYLEAVKRLIEAYKDIISDHDNPLDKHEAQNLFRQCSVLDLVMRFLNQVYQNIKLDSDLMTTTFQACNESVTLLDLLVKNNKVNALYLFQWKNFMNEAILSNQQQDLVSRTNINSVYFDIIDILQNYRIYTEDFIGRLCASISLKQFDGHKIDILIKILSSFNKAFNESSMEYIYQTMFLPKYEAEIFPKFLKRDHTVEVEIEKDRYIAIDERLSDDTDKFLYFMKVLKLGCLLTEIDLLKVSNKLSEIFPKEACMYIIENNQMSIEFRCLVLTIYSAVYILNPVYHKKITRFTDKIIVPGTIDAVLFESNLDVGEVLDTRENKNYLNKFIKDKDVNKVILYSSLKIIIQLLDTDIFTKTEVSELKKRIEELITKNHDEELDNQIRDARGVSSARFKTFSKLRSGSSLKGGKPTIDFSLSLITPRNLAQESHILRNFSEETIENRLTDQSKENSSKNDKYEYMIQLLDILLKINEIMMNTELKEALKGNPESTYERSDSLPLSTTAAKKYHVKDTVKSRKKARSKTKKATMKIQGVGNIVLYTSNQEVGSERLGVLFNELRFRQNNEMNRVIANWFMVELPAVFFKVLEYYQKMCRQRYYLYKTLNSHHLIQTEDEKLRYQKFKLESSKILNSMHDISKDFSPDKTNETKKELTNIYSDLNEIFEMFFEKICEVTRIQLQESNLKEQFGRGREYGIKSQLSTQKKNIQFNILNQFFMNLDDIVSNQTLMLKSGFLLLLIDLLAFFNQRIFSGKEAYVINIKLNDPQFDESLFAEKIHVLNQLNMMVLLLIYYCIFHNTTVASYLVNNHGEKILNLLIVFLQSPDLIFKKTSLMILTFLLSSHFETIYALNKRFRSQFQKIIDIYGKENRASNYEILVNYLEFFRSVCNFHNLILEKNFEMIYDTLTGVQLNRTAAATIATLMSEHVKKELISFFKNDDITKRCERLDFKKIRQQAAKERSSAETRMSGNVGTNPATPRDSVAPNLMDQMDENDHTYNIVKIPGLIIYANELLRFLSNVGALGSPELKAKIRNLFSLDSILEAYSHAREFWFLKITILGFLETIFVNQKLILKGKGQILDFIKESLLNDIKSYLVNKNNSKYIRLFMKSDISQINQLLLRLQDEHCACYNYFCFQFNDSHYYFVRESIIHFLKSFVIMCHADKDPNILDNLNDLIEEHKNRSFAAMAVGLDRQDSRGDSRKEILSPEKRNKSSHFFANTFKETIDVKKSDVLVKLSRLFEDDFIGGSVYAQMLEAEQTDHLLIHKFISRDEKPQDYKNDAEFKAQYLTDFSNFNKLLKSELEGMFKLEDNCYDVFIRECCMMLGSHKADSQSIVLLLRYLTEQVKLHKDKVQAFLFVELLIKNHITTNLINLMLHQEKDKSIVFSVIEFFKLLLGFSSAELQNSLYEELLNKDTDNKVPNILLKYLEEAVSNFTELEQLKAQVNTSESKVKYMKDVIETKLDEKLAKQVTDISSTFELLRLMCEGHFSKLQNYLRVQTTKTNLVKTYQVNFIERAIIFFKFYIKHATEQNELIAEHILRFLIEMVQGPCRDNQLEVIKKKLLEPLEDFHCNLTYSTYNLNAESNIKLINIILTLKLGIIESTKDNLIIKSLIMSLNMEVIWYRITNIFCRINGINIELNEEEEEESVHLTTRSRVITDLISKEAIGLLQNQPESEGNAKTVKSDHQSSYAINFVEALNSMILLNQLSNFGSEYSEPIESSYKKILDKLPYLKKARDFISSKIQSIEFVDHEQNLQTLYFYIHPKTEFLSKISINKFEERVDRRNWTSKASDLIKFVTKAYLEINHNYKLYRKLGIHVSVSYFYFFKFLNFSIAVVVNLIFLCAPQVLDESDKVLFRRYAWESNVERCAHVLCYIMLINYIIALILYVIYEFIVKIKTFVLEENEHELSALGFQGTLSVHDSMKISNSKRESFHWLKKSYTLTMQILFETKILLVLGLLACCILGLTVSKMYFAFLLLDIIEISPHLLNVIRSVTINFASLSSTYGFIGIIAYIYASIIYYNPAIRENMTLLDQDGFRFCDTYLTCFWNTWGYGIRSGGGLGDVMAMPDYKNNLDEYIYVSMFYMVFHITMILILMNIMLGIIIDSFAELRDIRNTIDNDKNNVCFICNITKQEFNNNGISFSKHTKIHSMWNYVFYIVGLLEKDPNEYTGIESYIYNKYTEKKLDWLPFQQTAMLKKRTVGEEEARDIKIDRIQEKLEELSTMMLRNRVSSVGGVVSAIQNLESVNNGITSGLGNMISNMNATSPDRHIGTSNRDLKASARDLKTPTAGGGFSLAVASVLPK